MALEDVARFLVAKYGTAAGPTGVPHTSIVAAAGDGSGVALVAVLGFLLFALIAAILVRDIVRARDERARLEREFRSLHALA